jgi:hypothetical protein
MPEPHISGATHRIAAQPPQPDLSPSPPTTNEVALPSEASSTSNDVQEHAWLSSLRLKSCPAVTKALSILVFIVSIVALWASVSSAVEARKATDIAKWTSKKEFIEFCENVRHVFVIWGFTDKAIARLGWCLSNCTQYNAEYTSGLLAGELEALDSRVRWHRRESERVGWGAIGLRRSFVARSVQRFVHGITTQPPPSATQTPDLH